MASERLSRSRPSGASRWLIFFGLALATRRVEGAAPTEWPVKKDADYGHVSVKNFDDSTSGGHLKINTGAGTTIKAASASTGGDIFANSYTASTDGISARLKAVEDRLAQLRDDFDDTSVAELTDLYDKCTSVHTSLSEKINTLETDINSTAFTPPDCSDDAKMRGIVRIGGEWRCMCKKNYTTGTGAAQSDYGACDVSPCALPSEFLSDANVVQNCAETHLKDGGTCTFSCKEYYRPNAAATQGIDGELTCASGIATGSTRCVVCTDNYSGPNCEDQSCDLGVVGATETYFGDSLVTDVDCNSQFGRYLNASNGCDYNCVADYMPYALAPTDSTLSPADNKIDKSGTVTCGDGDGKISGSGPNGEFCVACNNAYSGENCKLKSCDLNTAFYAAGSHVVAGESCPQRYLKATFDCPFDCEDGYKPHGQSDGARGTVQCAAADGTIDINSSDYDSANSIYCVECSNNRTGSNCVTASCTIPANFHSSVHWTDCATSLMKSGTAGDCSYGCAANTIGTTATTPGKAKMTCATPAVTPSANFCVTCDSKFVGTTHENKTGFDCETAACSLPTSMDTLIHDCGVSTMKEGGSCSYSCPSGMPSAETTVETPGSISCTTGSVSAHTCTDCNVILGISDPNRTGVNCATAACAIPANFGTGQGGVIQSCAKSHMEAGSTCTFSCQNGRPKAMDANGAGHDFTCDTDGYLKKTSDNTAAVLTCDSCVNDYSGVNCDDAPCNIDTTELGKIDNFGSLGNCTSTLPVGQDYDSVCAITCASGYELQAGGEIDCRATTTAGQDMQLNNVICVESDE